MAWTSHDQLFGWVHSFKLNRNNYIFGGRFGTNDHPYPVIVNRPSVPQVISNLNWADLGCAALFFLVGFPIARRLTIRDVLTESIVERRSEFLRFHRVISMFGFVLAMRNSAYRLEGFVPNGLPKEDGDLIKYDFTSELINTTFWRYFIESHDKPLA